MDGIKEQQFNRAQETIERQHVFELRKQSRENRNELNKIQEKKEAAISDIKKDFDGQVLKEQRQTEVKLTELRKKNEELLRNEDQRYERTLRELKTAHDEQMAELKLSQSKEIERQKEEHQNYLDNARNKFETAKVKYEV